MLERIKIDEVLAHSAMKHDLRADAADIKKEMERQRGWYAEASCKLGLAQLCLGETEAASTTLLERVLRVCDPSESRAATFAGLHAEAVGHYARAAKLAMGQLDSKPGCIEVEQRYVLLI